jgi:hypothetical protein
MFMLYIILNLFKDINSYAAKESGKIKKENNDTIMIFFDILTIYPPFLYYI